ncbi:MAG TPA: alkaline phosphatase family protein [Pirellulaceae bacterium]|nr:alkaline phosphatase family protein [Pirellulaceae bacterium]HMO93616.1 alkaline phosphatase family protein [Pirellulaceae bacterium]HMP70488.1 alkaline phosphatase family protein [Pirellulaceae bacterium]
MSTIVFSIPGLRESDLQLMPRLAQLFVEGASARIEHTFPAVTWPSQATVLTGLPPSEHGVIANGFYWREKQQVEMWTAWNPVIQAPQVWDLLKKRDADIRTAAWFPMLSKGCNADFVCMPAPIHKPDGSEDLWCYTKPQDFYGELLEQLGHFPLKHFWGPLANIESSRWILKSAAVAASRFSPDFWYIYLPHLDYAAQKDGPNSPAALQACADLDKEIGIFIDAIDEQRGQHVWMTISEYVIGDVNHVTYPNRILRRAGLLQVREENGLEYLDFENSDAWALVDHQFSHVFVKDRDLNTVQQVVQLFDDEDGIQMVLSEGQLEYLQINHERSGDVVLISEPNSWQAYYWWFDDLRAPEFARTVDIHRKPGYDPVELFIDRATMSIPLDASLVKGSHGAPAVSEAQRGVFLSSVADCVAADKIQDTEILQIMLDHTRPA